MKTVEWKRQLRPHAPLGALFSICAERRVARATVTASIVLQRRRKRNDHRPHHQRITVPIYRIILIFTVPVLSSSSHSLASGPVHTRSCVCGWAWVRATSLYQGKNVLKTSMARLLAARHRRGSKLYWTPKRRLANLADARHRKRSRQLQEDLTQWQELCTLLSNFECLRDKDSHGGSSDSARP